MKSTDIRSGFLEFFREHGHRVVPSSPLVPQGDPTLLFTNAGMVQFKDYFLGIQKPESPRAASAQKVMRVSGKHNDLENVGPSPRHHTFFEMLGNFSFGDYFKEDAIRFGWDLVTRVWGLPAIRLFATVYEKDDEAFDLWVKLSSLPPERVHRCGEKDNFWAMGETGPCGPCSEIFVDLQPGLPEVGWEEGTDSGRYMEIWNLVFMQFDRDTQGNLTPLPKPSIDTGMGLERITSVLQGVLSNYDTDLFQPILAATADLAHARYGADAEKDVSMRVIADHLRAVSFLLADGVIPGNEGRGYVLRRILRRAVRHGMRLGFEEPFLFKLVPVLGEVMAATRQASMATIKAEEEKFLSTVANGARQVQEEIERLRPQGTTTLPGPMAFRLYDTYGLPWELIQEIAEEERFQVDEAGFKEALNAQKEQSRKATAEAQNRLSALREVLRGHAELTETRFEGYDRTEMTDTPAEVVRLATWREGAPVRVSTLQSGQVGVVILDQTVFYAESGGEVGDTGEMLWDGGRARVVDTQKDQGGVFFHFVEVEQGSLARHTKVLLRVDHERRLAIQRNHTSTHLLHAALRQVLGKSVRQAGSLVAPDRLRFDFTYHRGMFRQEWEQTEDLVNEWVRRAVPTELVCRRHGAVRREVRRAGAHGERPRLQPGAVRRLPRPQHGGDRALPDRVRARRRLGGAPHRGGDRRSCPRRGPRPAGGLRRAGDAARHPLRGLRSAAPEGRPAPPAAERAGVRDAEAAHAARLGGGLPLGRRGAAGRRHPGARPGGAARAGQRAARHGRHPALQAGLRGGGDRHPRRRQRQPGRRREQGPDRARQGGRPGQEALRHRRRRRRRAPRLRPGRRQGAREAPRRPRRRRAGGARAARAVGSHPLPPREGACNILPSE
jgi:alanyl-tRNA synthetase